MSGSREWAQAADTIASISSAVNTAGIGIIRISGPDAFVIADRIYESPSGKRLAKVADHTIHYGHIVSDGRMLDEVLVSVMHAPHTYTAEHTVEINCHGGVYAMQCVLEAVIGAGARPAEPGEFTKRAFLNGRIDLSRAEAVMDVIQAKNSYALQNSLKTLGGALFDQISTLRKEILLEAARIEAALDDPEHYSLDEFAKELPGELLSWREKMKVLVRSYESGRILQEGIRTVILGKPNAGKSSLLNQLIGAPKAIVTDIAGTTRDVLTETIRLGAVTLNLADTAGIRRTQDPVEQIGVERAILQAEDADLILYVVDGSTPLDENDRQILSIIAGKRAIVLRNKSDLKEEVSLAALQKAAGNLPLLSVSARSGEGIDALRQLVQELFFAGNLPQNDEIYLTSARQKDLLLSAGRALDRVEDGMRAGLPEDFLTIDLMDACSALGQITGEETSEDLINSIFEHFCMGK